MNEDKTISGLIFKNTKNNVTTTYNIVNFEQYLAHLTYQKHDDNPIELEINIENEKININIDKNSMSNKKYKKLLYMANLKYVEFSMGMQLLKYPIAGYPVIRSDGKIYQDMEQYYNENII